MGNAEERHDDIGCIPFLDGADGAGFLRADQGDACIAGTVFGLDEGFEGVGVGLPFGDVVGRDGDEGLRLATDGVGLVSAAEGQKLEIVLEFRVQETDKEPQGIGPFLVDIVAAMAALAAGDAKPERTVSLPEGFPLEFEGGRGVNAAGAADEELPFVLGIQVDQRFPFEETGFQGEGAVHARLLGNREQALQLAHGQVAFQQGKAGGDADAVIGPERRVLRDHPSVFDRIGNRVGQEIEGETGILLTDHVLMCLEDQRGNLFLAGSGFLHDDDITGLVGAALELVLCSEILKESRHRLLMTGFTGDLRDLPEDIKYGFSVHILTQFWFV